VIRTIIVDDEEPARGKLHRWLSSETDIQIAGEYADGLSASQSIIRDSPDVVFLDIQMPGLNGLQVAAQLELGAAPLVVFVTAYDAHALAAFDLGAVDYLLKPYDEERFRRALDRVRDRLHVPEHHRSAVVVARQQIGVSDRLLVPAGDGLRMIDSVDIHCLEADDNYVHVHTADQTYLLRRTLRDLLHQLGEQRFVRIHKSAAVNIAQIDALTPLFKGDYELRLRSGRLLRLSRRYTTELFNRTGG
jgi:two-component system LytT family response regulator